jgi:stage II sporulation protein D
VTNVKLFVLLMAMGLLSSCSHITPARVRKMPLIKVLHDGAVEKVALEKYVASVLAGEVHHSWPLESLKAQAIAARTFALLRMQERRNNDYHVQNSVMDQVLKKKPNEIFVRAARESAGLVLSLDGRLAETSFHSTCGGKTTDSKSVWGRSYPHLTGNECGYCKASPTYTWRAELPLADVENKFSQKISGIKILRSTKDGRVDLIELSGSKTQKISGHEFRMAIGAMKVKSTFIKELTIDDGKVKISGQGFGHGVGMCQYGALGMGKAGKTYQEILSHYYPGTSIKRIY